MHPLTGTWTANIAKSTRHENHQFASASMHFDIAGGEVRFTYEGVNASGQHEKATQVVHADGQEHGHPQAPGIVVMSSVGPRSFESTAKKDGAIVGRGLYDVSDDGQMMTATVRGVDAAGKPFEQVIVFDRRE